MTLKTPIAIIVYAANMPGFLRSGHIYMNTTILIIKQISYIMDRRN